MSLTKLNNTHYKIVTNINILNKHYNNMAGSDINFLFYVMFWTILAMMLVLLYSLKQVISTQSYIKNIDINLEKLVIEILRDEEKILQDLEGKSRSKVRKLKRK